MRFDRFVIDPNSESDMAGVERCIQRLLSLANARQRTRTVLVTTRNVLASISQESEGELSRSGGGVPNSYRNAATTTVFGVAWVTDGLGRRHVMVMADRVKAIKSAYGQRDHDLFPGKHYLTSVYPLLLSVLRELPARKKLKGKASGLGGPAALVEGLRQLLRDNPYDADTWLALADWVDEQPSCPDWCPRQVVDQIRQVFGGSSAWGSDGATAATKSAKFPAEAVESLSPA